MPAFAMRISDWSSDVCSSARRLCLAIAAIGRQQRAVAALHPRQCLVHGGHRGHGHFTAIHARLAGGAQGELAMRPHRPGRSEEHTTELQSLMRISYAVFRLTKKTKNRTRKAKHNTLEPNRYQ